MTAPGGGKVETMSKYSNPKVCFTGFGFDQSALYTFVEEASYWPVRSVPRDLKYLVVSDAPTEWKVEKAQQLDIPVLTMPEFEKLIGKKFIPPPPPPRPRLKADDISMAVAGAPDGCSKAHLFRLAESAGFFVYGYGAITPKSLSVLVVGESPGKKTLQRAQQNGAIIVSTAEFIRMVKTGIDKGAIKARNRELGQKVRLPVKVGNEEAVDRPREHENTPPRLPVSALDENNALAEFRTMVEALTCDAELTDGEFEYLCDWLRRHDHLTESKVIGLLIYLWW